MFCPKCGNALPEGARFCTQCGAAIAAPAPAPTEPAPQPVPAPPAQPFGAVPQGEPVPQNQPFNAAPQAGYYMPQGQPAPVNGPKRKSKKGLVLGIIAAVLAVAVLVGALNFSALANVYMRNFASPADYYHHVENNAVKALAAKASQMADGSELQRDAHIDCTATVTLGEAARSLVAGMTDADLSWLESLSLQVSGDKKDGRLGAQSKLLLNDVTLFSPDVMLDAEAGAMFVRIEEFSEQFMQLALDDADSAGVFGTLLGGVNAPVTGAQAKDLITRYGAIFAKAGQAVEKEDGTLAVEGMEQDYLQLTVTYTAQEIADLIRAVADEVEDDPTLPQIMEQLAGENDRAADAEDALEQAADRLKEEADRVEDSDRSLAMQVFVNGAGGIAGRVLTVFDESGNQAMELSVLHPQAGDRSALLMSLTNDDVELVFSGSGKQTDGRYNGEYKMVYNGMELAAFTLEDAICTEQTVNGKLTVAPNVALLRQAGLPDVLCDNPMITVECSGSGNQQVTSVELSLSGEALLTVSADMTRSEPHDIETVQNALTQQEWSEEISTGDMQALMERLREAGVPDKYIAMLLYLR